MSLQRIDTPIADLVILQPRVFSDPRGFFLESYNYAAFEAATGMAPHFVQDNHSRSGRGVLRGLHYQNEPHAQGKLVRVVSGCVFDVAVDLRPQSPTLGQWHGVELSDENHRQFWIPPGFAHGFVVLSETADFLYKTTAYYQPASEGCIRWNDPDLAIRWPELPHPPQVSAKDAQGATWRDTLAQILSKPS
jgi:dTDP-4-dehydrorhamnose 3,5-epimerase